MSAEQVVGAIIKCKCGPRLRTFYERAREKEQRLQTPITGRGPSGDEIRAWNVITKSGCADNVALQSNGDLIWSGTQTRALPVRISDVAPEIPQVQATLEGERPQGLMDGELYVHAVGLKKIGEYAPVRDWRDDAQAVAACVSRETANKCRCEVVKPINIVAPITTIEREVPELDEAGRLAAEEYAYAKSMLAAGKKRDPATGEWK